MAVNVIADIMKHKDEEIIEFLSKTMSGIVKNYDVSVKEKEPALLWGNIGDLVMVQSVLKAMKERNNEKLAQMQKQL